MNIDMKRFYSTINAFTAFNGPNCGLCQGELVTVLGAGGRVNSICCTACQLLIQCYTDQYGLIAIDSVIFKNFSFYSSSAGRISVYALKSYNGCYVAYQESEILSLVEVTAAMNSGRLDRLCALKPTVQNNNSSTITMVMEAA